MKRVTMKGLLFNTPKFMYVNYKLFLSFFERAPVEKDLIYPIKLDIYRATSYY